jgi:predicted MFS family arabinose efflux permease
MKISNVSTFSAFKSTDYALYFIGRSVSQFGTWMQRTAVAWIVYSATHSAFMLGLTVFAEQFPSFLFSAFGGVVADRYNKYKIVNITQIISLVQACLLAALVMANHYAIWQIIVLSVILGIVNAYDVPARQSMINEVVVDKSDLPSALSLSAAMANIAKLLGPAASGIILERFGAGVCFLLNAASFGAVMLTIAFMEKPGTIHQKTKKKAFKELAEGFIYLKQEASIGLVIVMLCILGLLVLPYDTLIPVFAKIIFKGNAATFGYITSFIGAGAVAGTILLASLKQSTSLRKILLISTVILGIGMILFSCTTNFLLALPIAVIIGLGAGTQFTTCNIIVQSEAAPEMRGRAVSIILTAIFGMLPLGSLIVGAVSQKIGAQTTLFCQGIIAIVVAGIFFNILKKKDIRKNNIDEEEFEATEETF